MKVSVASTIYYTYEVEVDDNLSTDEILEKVNNNDPMYDEAIKLTLRSKIFQVEGITNSVYETGTEKLIWHNTN